MSEGVSSSAVRSWPVGNQTTINKDAHKRAILTNILLFVSAYKLKCQYVFKNNHDNLEPCQR